MFASICLLSYQRPEILTQTLASIKEKTTAPYELIVHDDGSSDPIVREELDWSLETGDISTIIRNPKGHNQGQGVALNRMFNIAKGDPIIKMDADVILADGWLEEVNDIMNNNDDVGLLGLLHYTHDPVDMRKTEVPDILTPPKGCVFHTHILGSAFAVSEQCWYELGPFQEHSDAFSEDWDFQKRVNDHEYWYNALPDRPLAFGEHNMGLGKSSLFLDDGSVRSIHKEPYIINKEG